MGTDFGKRGHFWQPKSVGPDQFWQQKWSERTDFGRFFCQNQSGQTNFRGTGFGVTGGMIFLEGPATPKRLYNIYNLEQKIVR